MASVSNGKRHVIKRKQTREKVCGLCLTANSCNMQNQNKYFGNSQSFPPPFFQLNFRHCICVTIFTILESQSEKLWHQNYKLRPQNYKLRLQNYKHSMHSFFHAFNSVANRKFVCNVFLFMVDFQNVVLRSVFICWKVHIY